MSRTGTVSPPVRVSAQDRREQYLAAAADIIKADGVAMVTMEAVAVAVGVNKALLYRQFDNRGELLLALYQRETAELDRSVQRAMDAVDGFEAKIHAWARAWFDYIRARGRLLGRLMEARTVAPEVARAHKDRLHTIEKVYGDWYAEEFALPVEVAHDAAAILYAGLSGVIDRWVSSPNRSTRLRLERTYVELLVGALRGVAAAEASSPSRCQPPSTIAT